MAYSYITYTGDGSTQIYTVPFPFIKKEDIHVYVDAVEIPEEGFEWLSDASIKLKTAPESGVTIRIRRITDKEEAVVDFQDGSVLSSEDLDQNTRQLLFVSQEAYDALEGTPTIDNDNRWDMLGLPIKNVGPARDPDDAVTYRQYATDMLPSMQQLQQQTAKSEQAAKASEQAARTSEQAAADSRAAAAASAAGALSSEQAAATSESQAEEWKERARAWAESPTPPDPDDPASKSAKTWAEAAADIVPIATSTVAGKVKPQTGDNDGLELEADGTLRVRAASKTQRGGVILSSALDSASEETSATSAAVKQLNDVKFAKAGGALSGSVQEKVVTLSGAAPTIDLSQANTFIMTVTENTNLSAVSFTGTGHFELGTLVLTNGGNFEVTWPASFKWADGVPPTLTADGSDVITFFSTDGGTTVFAVQSMAGLGV